MSNKTEIWDIYDKDRQKTGRHIQRGKKLKQGDYHLVVHVCIMHEGKMLIQRRHRDKSYGGLWAITCGGSALSGEASPAAASRELFEELSIQHDFNDERPAFTINGADDFADFYIIRKAVDLSTLVLQESEVIGVAWASLSEIYDMMDNKTFANYKRGLIALCFDMDKGLGNMES